MVPHNWAIDLLVKEHKNIHMKNKIRAKVEEITQQDNSSKNKTATDYKVNYTGYLDSNRAKAKEDIQITPVKKKQVNNFFEGKNKLNKLKVEIELPVKEENQLKYSITTTSSDNQKIIYLKQKKKDSKEDATDPEEILNRFVEEGDIVIKPKSIKKAPVKNAKAFLTPNFANEFKTESHRETKVDKEKLSLYQRLSSANSNANEKILEKNTVKSWSKDSRKK